MSKYYPVRGDLVHVGNDVLVHLVRAEELQHAAGWTHCEMPINFEYTYGDRPADYIMRARRARVKHVTCLECLGTIEKQ